MAFAGGGLNRPSAREPAPGPRFFFFAIVSLVLMYYDQRDGWSTSVRYALQATVYPVQAALGSPRKLWYSAQEWLETRENLRAENTRLREHERELSLLAMRVDALEQENASLRGLTEALPPLVSRSQVADIISSDLGRLRQRLVVNKGDRQDIFRGQAVVDAAGLMGQTIRVGPWSAEIMLITDPEHAVPVEFLRTGLRTIAVGSGSSTEMELPYLPVNSDVREGDRLVTSGLGGVFPAGVPVGVVTRFERDPDQILARVRMQPSATLDNDRQVMLLWFTPTHPAAPMDPQLATGLPPAPVAQPVVKPSSQGTPPPQASP